MDADNRIHRIIDNYKPKTETEYEDKKRVVSILNKVKNFVLDFYLNRETISKPTKRYKPQRSDKALSRYSQHSKSVGEIEYNYHEAIKYSKLKPEETVSERVKSNPRKIKKQEQESKS